MRAKGSIYGPYRVLKSINIVNTRKNFFYSRVLVPNELGCMIWTGAKDRSGYGMMSLHNKKSIKASRYSYQLHYGLFNLELFVCHTCDNPACVAPNHLFLGTDEDNKKDMISKNRDAKGEKNGISKLTEKQVIEIRHKLDSGVRNIDISKEYNIAPGTITAIKKRTTWNHI